MSEFIVNEGRGLSEDYLKGIVAAFCSLMRGSFYNAGQFDHLIEMACESFSYISKEDATSLIGIRALALGTNAINKGNYITALEHIRNCQQHLSEHEDLLNIAAKKRIQLESRLGNSNQVLFLTKDKVTQKETIWAYRNLGESKKIIDLVDEHSPYELRWEKCFTESIINRDPLALVKFVKNCKPVLPVYYALTRLFCYSAGAPKGLQWLPTPKTILRRMQDSKDQGSRHLINGINNLEIYFEKPADFQAKFNLLASTDSSHLLDSLLEEILFLGVASKVFLEAGDQATSAIVSKKYSDLCLKSSNNQVHDQFEIFASFLSLPKLAPQLQGLNPRMLKYSWVASKVGMKIFSNKLKGTFRKKVDQRSANDEAVSIVADLMAQDLPQMGGMALKILQLGASMTTELPAQVRNKLNEALAKQTPISVAQMTAHIEESYQNKLDNVFATFNNTSFATGSTAQVHEAVSKDGERLAVKVSYPKIKELIKTDFKILNKYSWVIEAFYPTSDIKNIYKVWEKNSLEECNIKDEAEMTKIFAEIFSSCKDIHVPKIIDNLTNDNVLVMNFLDGIDFKTFSEIASQEERNQAALSIMKSFLLPLSKGYFRKDLFVGNYLFRKDGISLLDLGLVYKEPEDVKFFDQIKNVYNGDKEAFYHYFHSQGFISNAENFDLDYFFDEHSRLHFAPFMSDNFKIDDAFVKQIFNSLMLNKHSSRAIKLPPKKAYIMRFYWGLYGLLASLNAECNWRQVFEEILEDSEETNGASERTS